MNNMMKIETWSSLSTWEQVGILIGAGMLLIGVLVVIGMSGMWTRRWAVYRLLLLILGGAAFYPIAAQTRGNLEWSAWTVLGFSAAHFAYMRHWRVWFMRVFVYRPAGVVYGVTHELRWRRVRWPWRIAYYALAVALLTMGYFYATAPWQWVLFGSGAALLVVVERNLQRTKRTLASVLEGACRVYVSATSWLAFYRFFWAAVSLAATLIVVLQIGAFALHCAEPSQSTEIAVGDPFANLDEAAHTSLLYIFGEVEDRAPRTPWGWRAFAMVGIIGLVATSHFIGVFLTNVLSRRSESRMVEDVAVDSFLIVGWNRRAPRVVKELQQAASVRATRAGMITILTDELVETAKIPDMDDRGITIVNGDPTDLVLLKKIGAHLARAVIILGHDTHRGVDVERRELDFLPVQGENALWRQPWRDPDSRAARISLAFQTLCHAEYGVSKPRKGPRISAEVLDVIYEPLLRRTGANETICHQNFGMGILAQAALNPGMTDVFRDLLEYGTGTNEFYVVQPENSDGEFNFVKQFRSRNGRAPTFRETCVMFAGERRHMSDNPAILVGLQDKDGNMDLNPTESDRKINTGDALILIAYQRPHLDTIRVGVGKSLQSLEAVPERVPEAIPETPADVLFETAQRPWDPNVVIVGWNRSAHRVIYELHLGFQLQSGTAQIGLLTRADESAVLDQLTEALPQGTPDDDSKTMWLRDGGSETEVRIISGEPTELDWLKKVGATTAPNVILLGRDASQMKKIGSAAERRHDPDGVSALVALALENEHELGSEVNICAEVLELTYRELLEEAGADETVCHEDYGLGILAQTAINPGVAGVFGDLLRYGDDTNEFYILSKKTAPEALLDRFVGMTFRQATMAFAAGRHLLPGNPAVLVGLARADSATSSSSQDSKFRITLNPREDTPIRQGDGLIVMAYRPPDLAALMPALEQVRQNYGSY